MRFVLFVDGKGFINNLPEGDRALSFTFNLLNARRLTRKTAVGYIQILLYHYDIEVDNVVVLEIVYNYGRDTVLDLDSDPVASEKIQDLIEEIS